MPGTKAAMRRALDGSKVALSSPADMSLAFTSDVMAALHDLGGRQQRICAGPAEFAFQTAFDADVALGMTFEQDLTFQGGRLRVGVGRSTVGLDGTEYWDRPRNGPPRITPYRIAVWEGRNYSFYAHLYGGEAEDLLQSLSRLTVTEHEDGLTCTPTSPSTKFVKQASVMQVLPLVGVVYALQLTAETARSLPRHPGTKVKGGELYAHHKDEPEAMHFVLANDTSVTQIVPDNGVPEDDLMDCVSGLEVNWEATG
jgi:hypothetical protein